MILSLSPNSEIYKQVQHDLSETLAMCNLGVAPPSTQPIVWDAPFSAMTGVMRVP